MHMALSWLIAASGLATENQPASRLTWHLSCGLFIADSARPARASQNFALSEFSSPGREDPRADALGPLDVESGLGLAVFFESAADIFECLGELNWLAGC